MLTIAPRGDWGSNYYGAKIEGTFTKYRKISNTGGWIVITKDGTKYYYGTTSASRQSNANGVFKWNLDKVEDTNGNYMAITYWKDQGEIYLDRIDYAGNTAGLSPTNYVKFYLESRTDISPMYISNALVKTAYRLKTIEVYGNGQLTRKYALNYDYSPATFRSLLISVIQYGSDGVTSLLATTFEWNEASGFEDQGAWVTGAYGGDWVKSLDRIRNADVNGDGRTDIVLGPDGSGNWYVLLPKGQNPDLLSTISNSIGATTSLEYLPSSKYDNRLDIDGKTVCLPFVVQTLSSVTTTTKDINGTDISSTTNITYSGGYFDYVDREYRGFQYVKATVPDGTTTESWFKQDDILKGFVYEQVIKDLAGNLYTRTYNTYQSASPYTGVNFPYLNQKDDYVYDGTSTYKQATTSFTYDTYGNVTRKYLYGNVSVTGDERDEYTDYTYDTVNWIVSLPSSTYSKDNSGITKAQTWFAYDTKGNLLTKTAWLDGGINPVTTYTYDAYGNVQTIKDPKDNPPTTITYDTVAQTYPATIQNPLGHTVNKTYDYRFGKPLTETDPNNNTTTYEYDIFGRLTKVTNPYDTNSTHGTISYSYLDFGTIGNQRVVTYATELSGTGNYIWSETYFDGLGRTIKTRSEGPDSRVIAQGTFYNNRGNVSHVSLPYFEGTETERWTYFEYDPIDRVKKVTNPDGTYVTKSYRRGRTTLVDANGHQKIEETDVYGRLIKVNEYAGVSPNVTLYSTTTYQYDVLGNLTKVTDARNNQTTLTYDSLSRKTSMTDPDMGYWVYQYDANGNLTYQKDAKNQAITFTYDALNRITKKDYPTGTDTVYTYDQTFSANSKGRLTTVTDASGTTKFYYNKLGQTVKILKTVDSINYTTQTTYDTLGRTRTITYPDSTMIKYEYDTGGNLYRVKDNSTGFAYATCTDYNALGQIGKINFGNGVDTTYQYLPQNNRLSSITTLKMTLVGGMTRHIQLLYAYDNVGNITGITDYLDITRNRTYGYDDLNRLTSATSSSYGGTLTWQYNTIGNMTYNSRYGNYSYADPNHVHAVTRAGTDTYQYDANGNMISGAGRTITYNYDNMPTGIAKDGVTTTSVYDASGQRVKKVTDGITTIYLGKYCEYTNGACTKYIFGGSDRIVSIEGSIIIRYYHTDHLGSSSVITDRSGNSVQSIYYYPYGEIHTNNGADVARYKFSGQEYDAETGLYYYNARYYDPKLARFITADTIVPDFTDPQALNRYSYARNNPVIYKDPTGHWFGISAIIGALVGGISAAIQGGDFGDILKGMVIGAVSGVVFTGVSGYVGEVIAHAGIAGGVGPPTAGWALAGQVGGAIAGGAMTGAVSSGMYGGNVWQGTLYGAIGGAAFGAIGAYYGNDYWGWDRVAVSGLANGGINELAGGRFMDGFMFASVPVAARALYNERVNYDTTWAIGGDAVVKGYLDPPVEGANNIGTQGGKLNPNGWFNEGGRVSRFANRIPGINAVAGMHDMFQINLDMYLGNFARNIFNVPGMLPAFAITYSALVTDYSGIVNYQTVLMRDERR